jgi:catechol 2,3-dioxygenase-like lactoylglutathione lyase family enzyme
MSDSSQPPAESTEPPVDATNRDSTVGVVGTDHITLEGTNTEDTIEYYRDILGMPLVLRQPNLDRRHLTHLFFDAGDGRLVTFFVNEERDSADLSDPDPGQVHHMAFRIEGDRIDEIKGGLEDAGYPVSEYDRGAFHSLYTEDNNGLTIELVADKFPVPDERRGEVLALAQQLREADGADFVESEHMREAIEQLDLDVDEQEVGDTDAATGRDFE